MYFRDYNFFHPKVILLLTSFSILFSGGSNCKRYTVSCTDSKIELFIVILGAITLDDVILGLFLLIESPACFPFVFSSYMYN